MIYFQVEEHSAYTVYIHCLHSAYPILRVHLKIYGNMSQGAIRECSPQKCINRRDSSNSSTLSAKGVTYCLDTLLALVMVILGQSIFSMSVSVM